MYYDVLLHSLVSNSTKQTYLNSAFTLSVFEMWSLQSSQMCSDQEYIRQCCDGFCNLNEDEYCDLMLWD